MSAIILPIISISFSFSSRSSAISDERIKQETERVFLGQKALKVPALLLYYNKEERKQKTGQNAAKNW